MFQSERIVLEHFLQALKYPMDKQQIIQQAEEKSLPRQLVQLLQRLDEKQYAGADEVESTLLAHKA